MKKKIGAVLTALVLTLGIGVAAAAPAQAWQETVGPFGSQPTCDQTRYNYVQAYGARNVSASCWQQTNGTTNKGKWFFFVVHN